MSSTNESILVLQISEMLTFVGEGVAQKIVCGGGWGLEEI